MIITRNEEQTTIDGESHATFIKREKFGMACLHVGAGVENYTIQNFHWQGLTRNPFKDCWILFRWYFSKR